MQNLQRREQYVCVSISLLRDPSVDQMSNLLSAFDMQPGAAPH